MLPFPFPVSGCEIRSDYALLDPVSATLPLALLLRSNIRGKEGAAEKWLASAPLGVVSDLKIFGCIRNPCAATVKLQEARGRDWLRREDAFLTGRLWCAAGRVRAQRQHPSHAHAPLGVRYNLAQGKLHV